jgi:hypothetical protein
MIRQPKDGETADRADPDTWRAAAELLAVSAVVDCACNETTGPPVQLLEGSRSIHQALLALYDWNDPVTPEPTAHLSEVPDQA